MGRSLKWAIGAAALAAASAAQAQSLLSTLPAASASASASVTVTSSITLLKNSDLAFGSLVRPSIGTNTVTVDRSSGLRSISGAGDGSLGSAPGSRATYTVGGVGGSAFTVHVPNSFNMTRIGSTDTVSVALSPSASTAALGTNGSTTFAVGGSVPLTINTAPGNYTGTFDVTVGYN